MPEVQGEKLYKMFNARDKDYNETKSLELMETSFVEEIENL